MLLTASADLICDYSVTWHTVLTLLEALWFWVAMWTEELSKIENLLSFVNCECFEELRVSLWDCAFNPTPTLQKSIHWWLTDHMTKWHSDFTPSTSLSSSSFPADIWSTSTHMNVKNGDWAPPASFRQLLTATGGKDVGRATAPPSSTTHLWAPPPSWPHQRYTCPTYLCPLTTVAISPRCLWSRKVK